MQQSNLDAPALSPVVLVWLDWYDGGVWLHSGLGDLVFEGVTYRGVGNLGAISRAKESGQIAPHTLTLTLSGLDQTQLAEVLQDKSIGRPAKITLGLLDDSNQIMDSSVLFAGRIASAPIRSGTENAVSVRLISRLADWDKGGNQRYNNANHQQRHPGDTLFQYVAAMAERPIYWGSKKDAAPLKA
ncbi:hypothetical protein K6Y31_20695 [Motilimonas cestriensis]|uniref:Uncharacterized protein n=1 Tax=Motilimonas cestriensis TaxID=2742685 RepID=A0ABS8WDR8_9GAMM|nr:hypothetical protein [Motilimonas cestriensis]MCE2597196.1 hypothetical protein [Motilimonas cestriensis]